MLHQKPKAGNHMRTPEQSTLLTMAAVAMETHKAMLQIPERDIKIMRYLADNPGAVLIAEPNVRRAFDYGRKALEASAGEVTPFCL